MIIFCIGVVGLISAQGQTVPGILSHQGRIVDNATGLNRDGIGYFKFSLVANSGKPAETIIWHHDGTSTSQAQPGASVAIAISKGLYAVPLGETAAPWSMLAISPELFANNSDLALRIWFSSDNSTFEQLSPDGRILPAGYAQASAVAHAVVDGAITGTMLAAASITPDKLSPGYTTGSIESLNLQSVDSNGVFTLSETFGRAFVDVPLVELESSWTLGPVTKSGFTISGGFAITSVDTAGVVGADTSLAIINGRPAISYRDLNSGKLKFASASDAQGISWPAGSIVVVDGALADVGYDSSLIEVDGRPAIGYYDAQNLDLKFVRANDSAGTSWPAATVVDGSATNVGKYASLAVIGGVPAISYYDTNAGNLKYVWAADAQGSSWPSGNIVTIDGIGVDAGRFTSLAEIGGKPAISYYNVTTHDLKFIYLSGTDPGNPAHWSSISVDSSGDVGSHTSLAVVDGFPAISYTGAGTAQIKYARAGNATGSIWPAANRRTVTTASVGETSLAVVGNRPGISFYDSASGNLKFAWAAETRGTTWPASNIITVDGATSNVGAFNSLINLNGTPAISYHSSSDFDLKFASLPAAQWTAASGGPAPILASGVKDGAVKQAQLAPEIGVWTAASNDLHYLDGKVGIGRVPASNPLEVEGNASKTTAGSWLANSDRQIKTNIVPLENGIDIISRLRPVRFRYSEEYRAAHPTIEDRDYINFIAQEFREVFPADVRYSGDQLPSGEPILQIDTYSAAIYSIRAVQELSQLNEQKDAAIDVLQQRLQQMEDRLSKLESK